MKDKIVWYLKGLLFERGEPSLTRFLAMASFLSFTVVTIYLVIYNINWQPYTTFATVTGGGGLVTQLANKINKSINNSPKDTPTASAYGTESK